MKRKGQNFICCHHVLAQSQLIFCVMAPRFHLINCFDFKLTDSLHKTTPLSLLETFYPTFFSQPKKATSFACGWGQSAGAGRLEHIGGGAVLDMAADMAGEIVEGLERGELRKQQ